MNSDQNDLNVGEDAVVIGNIKGNIGNGSVVIGATDSNGNTIINKPMAVGRNAKAGPGSIAIGANAGAGSEVFILLTELKNIFKNNNNKIALESVISLISELNNSQPDKIKIGNLWEIIKSMATVSGAISLIEKISVFLPTLQ